MNVKRLLAKNGFFCVMGAMTMYIYPMELAIKLNSINHKSINFDGIKRGERERVLFRVLEYSAALFGQDAVKIDKAIRALSSCNKYLFATKRCAEISEEQKRDDLCCFKEYCVMYMLRRFDQFPCTDQKTDIQSLKALLLCNKKLASLTQDNNLFSSLVFLFTRRYKIAPIEVVVRYGPGMYSWLKDSSYTVKKEENIYADIIRLIGVINKTLDKFNNAGVFINNRKEVIPIFKNHLYQTHQGFFLRIFNQRLISLVTPFGLIELLSYGRENLTVEYLAFIQRILQLCNGFFAFCNPERGFYSKPYFTFVDHLKKNGFSSDFIGLLTGGNIVRYELNSTKLSSHELQKCHGKQKIIMNVLGEAFYVVKVINYKMLPGPVMREKNERLDFSVAVGMWNLLRKRYEQKQEKRTEKESEEK